MLLICVRLPILIQLRTPSKFTAPLTFFATPLVKALFAPTKRISVVELGCSVCYLRSNPGLPAFLPNKAIIAWHGFSSPTYMHGIEDHSKIPISNQLSFMLKKVQ